MDSTISAPTAGQPVPALPVQPVQPQVPTPHIEPSYAGGGFLSKIEDFKIVEYVTFGLFIAVSIYGILYYRQALNKLNEDD